MPEAATRVPKARRSPLLWMRTAVLEAWTKLRRRLFLRLLTESGRRLAVLPGPDPAPLIGNLREIGKEPRIWRLLGRWSENHGRVVVFWAMRRPIVLMSDPALITEVLKHPDDADEAKARFRNGVKSTGDFYKNNPIPQLGPVLTVSSLVSNRRFAPTRRRVGDWERAAANSPLRFARKPVASGRPWMDAQLEPVHDVVTRTVRNLRAETRDADHHDERPDLDLLDAMRRLTWDALSVMAVGKVFEDPDEDRYNDFWTIVGYGEKRLRARMSVPRPSAAFDAAFLRWTRTFDELVAVARLRETARRGGSRSGAGAGLGGATALGAAAGPSQDDLLSMAAFYDDALTDRELAWEIGNIWYGGQMGIASTLVSTLYYLHRHPVFRAEVVDQLELRLGDKAPTSWRDLLACTLLDAAVREAQRLVPPVPLFFRNSSQLDAVTLGDDRTGRYTLPPDTTVLISSWGLHRDPSHWDRAEHFHPRRWLAEGFLEEHKYGSDWFFPFGRGPRECGGKHLARLCILSVLAALLRQTEVEIVDVAAFHEEQFATVLSMTWLRARFRGPPE